MTESDRTYMGRCFCGAVELAVTGAPVASGYCHCDSCRTWSAGPINAFTLWLPGAVQVTKGAEHLGVFQKTPRSERKYCTRCGGHVMTDHPASGVVDIYAAIIPDFPFKPRFHVNYAESVLPVTDALPKFADMPAEMGGSGKQITD